MSIGSVAGTSGTLNLNAGASINSGANVFNVLVGGSGGTGTIVQSGGSFTNTNGLLYVGGNSSAVDGIGFFTTTGGSFQQANISVGSYGTGVVNVQGGTLTTVNGGAFKLGEGDSATHAGSGTMSISSGTLKASTLYLAYSAGSTGSLVMSGGSITVPTSGNLNTYVGYSGTGTFTQTGGAFGAVGNGGGLNVGYNSGTNGTYNLSGTGTMTFGSLTIGLVGTGTMNLGAGGTATIGGTVSIGGGESGGGHGTLTMTGGHFIANGGTTYVGDNAAGGRAVFSISGGTLDTAAITVGLRAAGGVFNVIGSAATINVGAYNANQTATSVTSFALDNGGVSTINAPSGGLLNGTLKVGFKAGAALTASNSFTLINAGTNGLSNPFDVTPNASMWTSGRTAGLHTYLVTMAAASDKTALSTNSGSGEAQFTASTFGHL